MKISKSKQELARIISENGGWRDGEFAAQDKDGEVFKFDSKPVMGASREVWTPTGNGAYKLCCRATIKGWHQTILSRAEYFHLYPAPDAKTEFCESVMRSIPEPSDNPTIEQLAADYRNAKDCAERKRKEADVAKADAEAKLAELVAAGKALNLVISVAEDGPELVITDWRDLRAKDVIFVPSEIDNIEEGEYEVVFIEPSDYTGDRPVMVTNSSGSSWWIDTGYAWRFIRRP